MAATTRATCRLGTVLSRQQAEAVHQLCREVAAAVARHAACICMGRLQHTAFNARASYNAGGCSFSPACGGLFHRAPCSMHFTIAQSCL